MKKKAILISLSTIFAFQNVAYSQVHDRTQGIGDEAAMAAHYRLLSYRDSLKRLDAGLATSIKYLKNNNAWAANSNTISTVGSSIGIGVVAVAGLARMMNGPSSRRIEFVAFSTISFSLASAIANFNEHSIVNNGDAEKDLLQKTTRLQAVVKEMSTQVRTFEDRQSLTVLNDKLDELNIAVKNHVDERSQTSLLSAQVQMAQTLGAILACATITKYAKNNVSQANLQKAIATSAVIMGVANVASNLLGKTQKNNDLIIAQINQTRSVLKGIIDSIK